MIEILLEKPITRDSLIKGEITAQEFINRYLNPDNIPRLKETNTKFIEVLDIQEIPKGIDVASMSEKGMILKGKIKEVSKLIHSASIK